MDGLRAQFPDWEFTSDSSGQRIDISATRDIPMCDPEHRHGEASVTLHFSAMGDLDEYGVDDTYPVACVAATMKQYLEGA